jgi:hypothetical protein
MTKVVLPNDKSNPPKWDETTNWGESTWGTKKPRELTDRDIPAEPSDRDDEKEKP